jgi:chromosomal replication initiation ATPase DnaA
VETERVDSPVEPTVENVWNEVASRLQGALNETTYRTWFGDAEAVDVSDDAFVVAVPNDFTREWIEGHYVGLLRAIVQDATGRERRCSPRSPSRRRGPRGRSTRSTRSTPS